MTMMMLILTTTDAKKATIRCQTLIRYNNKQQQRLLSFVATILLLLCQSASVVVVHAKSNNNSKKFTTPHTHRGKLQPYLPGPFPNLILSTSEEQTLASGNSVMKQQPAATVAKSNEEETEISSDGSSTSSTSSSSSKPSTPAGGTAICIQDVCAPMSAVWYQILQMEDYPKKVKKVLHCTNYDVSGNTKTNDSPITIKTKQVLGVLPGYSYESYYDHTFYPEQSSLVWNLDYDKTSDMDDVVGHWHVTSHPKKGSQYSRVYYACDILMKGHVPKPIFNYISQAALKQATSWVKRESEAHPDQVVDATLGGNRLPITMSTMGTTATTTTGSSNDTTKPRRGWFGRR